MSVSKLIRTAQPTTIISTNLLTINTEKKSCQLPINETKNFMQVEFDSWKNTNGQVDDVVVVGIEIDD
jgi:hypothetical protein